MNMPNPEKLADNSTLQVLSRLSMLATPLLLTALVFFGRAWLDGRFDAQAAVQHQLRKDVDILREELPVAKERIKVVETNMARGREDREEFQRQTTITLKELQAGQAAQSARIERLIATLEAQQRQIDRKGR